MPRTDRTISPWIGYIVFLAYVCVSYLIICIYVAPPFTVVGDAVFSLPDALTAVDWTIIVLFFLYFTLGLLCRIPSVPPSTIALGYVALLACILLASIWALIMSRVSLDAGFQDHYRSTGTGTLGLGWLLWLHLIYSSRKTQGTDNTAEGGQAGIAPDDCSPGAAVGSREAPAKTGGE